MAKYRKQSSEKLNKIHDEALREFDAIYEAYSDERRQCLEDRRFYSIAGAQWEGDLSAQFENRPKLEVNKVHLAVMRIINEYRNNRITVDFIAKDGAKDDTADACDGLYRADEQDSSAQEAYDNAFEEAVGGGIGAWRLRCEYEDEYDDESEDQRIRIEPIYDADTSVYFDLNAKRQDKRDAMSCFVLTPMTRDSYVEEYGDDPTTWPKDRQQYSFDWAQPDIVFIAEYFKVEEVKTICHVYETLDGKEEKYTDLDFEADEDLEGELALAGSVERRSRPVKKRRVHKYILSGSRVLEDCGYIAGCEIPVVVTYGKRWYVDNIERAMGHVRLAKDAQRLKNMQLSKLAELSALSSTEKPLLTPEQVAGHEVLWAEDNIKNYPYLLINTLRDLSGNPIANAPTAYTKPPQIPPALGALLQLTEQDMADLLGNQQGAEEVQPNVSGKAIELVQTRLDMQAFIYMSNMAKAVKRCGEIWLSMAKEVYSEHGRKMKTIDERDNAQQIELGEKEADEYGETRIKNDLSNVKYDVAVSVGPSSQSLRQATVRSVMGLMQLTQNDQETQQVLASMALMNMDGEGIADVRDFYRKKLVKMGVVKPNEEERQQLELEAQNAQPDPNAQLLIASAQAEAARGQKAQADTLLSMAKVEETEANTIATLAEIDQTERELAMQTAQMLRDQRANAEEGMMQDESGGQG